MVFAPAESIAFSLLGDDGDSSDTDPDSEDDALATRLNGHGVSIKGLICTHGPRSTTSPLQQSYLGLFFFLGGGGGGGGGGEGGGRGGTRSM